MSQICLWLSVIFQCVPLCVYFYVCVCGSFSFFPSIHTCPCVSAASHYPAKTLTFHGRHWGLSTGSHQNFILNYGSRAGGSFPPPRGELNRGPVSRRWRRKKSIPTRLLPVKAGCLVILNNLRTQINTLNDLEISVPTRVFAQSLLKVHLERNATKTWNHYKGESFRPGGGKLQGTECRLNKP